MSGTIDDPIILFDEEGTIDDPIILIDDEDEIPPFPGLDYDSEEDNYFCPWEMAFRLIVLFSPCPSAA
jgi:hypothetical protein